MNNLAPILLFAYKRLDTLMNTVATLQKNYLARQSDLYIFSDAAKSEKDEPTIAAVRNFLQTVKGFKRVSIIEAPENKGLATSIISGVYDVIQASEKVIVLEDDLLTTPNFLSFMNQALDRYADAHAVFSVSGYSFNLGQCGHDSTDAYFLNRGWSWGWGTWKDRWDKVDWQVKDYNEFKYDKARQRAFAQGGSDLNKMLRQQMQGKLDSWAIRWFYHQYKVGGLTLYPVLSKIDNRGFDAFATHTVGSNKRYLPLLDQLQAESFSFPTATCIHPYYQYEFLKKMGIKARIKSKLEGIFSSLL